LTSSASGFAGQAYRIQTGLDSVVPQQRFLTEDESVAVAIESRDRHPVGARALDRYR
jgi:hypothetical protein